MIDEYLPCPVCRAGEVPCLCPDVGDGSSANASSLPADTNTGKTIVFFAIGLVIGAVVGWGRHGC